MRILARSVVVRISASIGRHSGEFPSANSKTLSLVWDVKIAPSLSDAR